MLDRLPHVCPVCAYHEWNLDGLVEMAWEYLDLIRVYTKPKARLFMSASLAVQRDSIGVLMLTYSHQSPWL